MKKLFALLATLFTFKKSLIDSPPPEEPKAKQDNIEQARAALIRLSTDAMERLKTLEENSAEYEQQMQLLVGYIELKKNFDKMTAVLETDAILANLRSRTHGL